MKAITAYLLFFSTMVIAQQCGTHEYCPTEQIDCDNDQCIGISDHLDLFGGLCIAGDYAGCPCRSQCGSGLPGPCDANGCEGISVSGSVFGVCSAGKYRGCTCLGTCNSELGACDTNGCEGKNNPGEGRGECTAGKYHGCDCESVCGTENGKCVDNGCNGQNGICATGKFKGCECDP